MEDKHLLITDFDGILSLGMWQDAKSNIWKNIACGNKEAVKIARDYNIWIRCVSSQANPNGKAVTEAVCTKLGIPVIFTDTGNKPQAIIKIREEVQPKSTCWVGDDLYDLNIARYVNVMCVPVASKPMLELGSEVLNLEMPVYRWLKSDKPLLEAVLLFIRYNKSYF